MSQSMGENSPLVARIDARGAKLRIFKVGERVVSRVFGNHGTVTFRLGGRYRVLWDNGLTTGGGFSGFDLMRER